MKLFICLLVALPIVMADPMVGGKTDITDSLSLDHEAVQFAVEQINAMRSAQNQDPLTLESIFQAESQLVEGTNYFLMIAMSGRHACRVTVNLRTWFNDDQRLQVVKEPECIEMLMGGWGFSDPLPSGDDEEGSAVLRTLAVAICKVDEGANAEHASVLGQDKSGVTYKSAVTYGITYKFSNVPLVSSTCPRQSCDNTDLTDCDIDPNGQKRVCELTIQAAEFDPNPYTLTNIACFSVA